MIGNSAMEEGGISVIDNLVDLEIINLHLHQTIV